MLLLKRSVFNNISPEREQRHELQVVYCPDKFNVSIAPQRLLGMRGVTVACNHTVSGMKRNISFQSSCYLTYAQLCTHIGIGTFI